MDLVVTTSGKPDEALAARARQAAARWGLPYVERGKRPLGPLFMAGAQACLVFGRDGVRLWDAGGSFAFHAGMAHLRRLRLDTGEGDPLVRVAELASGDSVLDCTLGLAQDALVAARAVGPRGRVVGVEKSLALCAVVSEGLAAFDPGPASCRVEVLHADFQELLRTSPERAFDVVLIDPMFDSPKKAQPAFDVLRRFAEHAPLSVEGLAQARRVARRWVVVKAGRRSGALQRLGLVPHPASRYTSVDFARLTPGTTPRGG